MTIIKTVRVICPDCDHQWQAYEGVSTNTFGMSAEQAKAHLKSFSENYSKAERKPCPACGSIISKEVYRE